MNGLHPLEILGGGIAACLYIPFIYLLLREANTKKGGSSVSFTSFALFFFLDLVVLISTIEQDGAWLFPAILCAGTFLVSVTLLARRLVSITRMNIFVAVLTVVCLIVYYTAGSYWSLYASLIAITLAGYDQLKLAWATPQGDFKYIWLGFLVASLCSLVGAVIKPEGEIGRAHV